MSKPSPASPCIIPASQQLSDPVKQLLPSPTASSTPPDDSRAFDRSLAYPAIGDDACEILGHNQLRASAMSATQLINSDFRDAYQFRDIYRSSNRNSTLIQGIVILQSILFSVERRGEDNPS
jgi:hypothetical protein